MPSSLRSILGKSNRISKPSSASKSPSQSPQKRSSPQKRPNARPKSRKEEDDELISPLEDCGVAKLLSEHDLVLRDVVQAMRYIKSHMFSPVPDRGFHSTRTAELLNFRRCIPGIVTMGHLHAILDSPTSTEREVVELISKGVLRKIRIERRGGMGEALIETADYHMMIEESSLDEEVKTMYRKYLKENPSVQVIPAGSLSPSHADALIRLGFLTGSGPSGNPFTTLSVRPEDRTTVTSIERISRHASGSVSAVGGHMAVHLAGGTPGLSRSNSSSFGDLRIAIPGNGAYLKLAAGGVDWIKDALARNKWGEAPESNLKDRFQGGGLYGPRWKDLCGLEWEWALGEAIGLGVVEIFDTGSVGRGVRAIGG